MSVHVVFDYVTGTVLPCYLRLRLIKPEKPDQVDRNIDVAASGVGIQARLMLAFHLSPTGSEICVLPGTRHRDILSLAHIRHSHAP
jgi:hypothetical protein